MSVRKVKLVLSVNYQTYHTKERLMLKILYLLHSIEIYALTWLVMYVIVLLMVLYTTSATFKNITSPPRES